MNSPLKHHHYHNPTIIVDVSKEAFPKVSSPGQEIQHYLSLNRRMISTSQTVHIVHLPNIIYEHILSCELPY